MTINELKDYLAKYVGEGCGNCEVVVCDHRENPITDMVYIRDALFIDSKNGDCYIVLQTE